MNLNARYSVWRLTFAVGVGYQGRYYTRSESYYGINAPRIDQRLMPTASATLTVTSWLDLEAGYLYIRNISNVGQGYDYDRHIGQIAIRGHF